MKNAGRMGDSSYATTDGHVCPACMHVGHGPSATGSSNVLINSQPALRSTDRGVHSTCAGAGKWEAGRGASCVLINQRKAHRIGDADRHDGSTGRLIEGSSNVLIGDCPGPNRPATIHQTHFLEIRLSHAKRGVAVAGGLVSARAPDGQHLSEISNGNIGHVLDGVTTCGKAHIELVMKRTREVKS